MVFGLLTRKAADQSAFDYPSIFHCQTTDSWFSNLNLCCNLFFFSRLPFAASFPSSPMLNLATVAPWLQNQGVYGPVTATLDWCEVKIRTFIRPNNQIIETWIGQLSILALYRRDGEYLFKHLYNYFGVVRLFTGDGGTFTVEISVRLCGSSLSFLPFVPSKTFPSI